MKNDYYKSKIRILVGIIVIGVCFALFLRHTAATSTALSRTGAKNDCGPHALVALLADYRITANPDSIALVAGTDDDGTTMLGLKRAADAFGVASEGMRLSIPSLINKLEDGHGVIAFVNGDHYVWIKRAHSLGFIVKDREPGFRFISREDWGKTWFEDADDAVDKGAGLCLVFAQPAGYRPPPKPYVPARGMP